MKEYRNYIGGEFVPAQSGALTDVLNPATEEVISRVPESNDEDANNAVDAAYAAAQEWAHMPSIERAEYLRSLCGEIRKNREDLARIITDEQGKTLSLARGEVDFCLSLMEYAAEWARRLEGEVVPSDFRDQNIFIYRQPYGVVACIIPWNFPLAVLGRKVGPALIAGNCVVVKPSSNTPNSALEFARLAKNVGVPDGVINVITGAGSKVGRALVRNPKVAFVSLTGSVEAGQQVMRDAAENVTRVSLELGGKAPTIVMNDADLDQACSCCVADRYFSVAGQICIGLERLYVQEDVAQEFTSKLVESVKQLKIGDPNLPETDISPLASRDALEKVEGVVSRAVSDGAKLLCGGKRPSDLKKGYYYEGTVLADVRQDMEIMHKEIFGPVIPIMTFSTIDDAIALANDCDYGLASVIYTRDLRTAMKTANELQFGETYINRGCFDQVQGFHAGWKKSGIGGDDGKLGVYEFLQTHVVTINYA